MGISTYFSLTATVIPVLLVAGLLNPVMLREYSKTPKRAKKAKRTIGVALIATGVSVIMALIASNDPESQWLTIATYLAAVLTGVALGNTSVFIYFLAKYALDENPHPERFEFERRDLERREARFAAERHLDAGKNRHSDNN